VNGIRHAIAAAPFSGGTIYVCAGAFQSQVTFANDVTIVGAGAERTVLDANAVHGLPPGQGFLIRPGNVVTMRNLTITNGRLAGRAGGGIANQGKLTLKQVTVNRNVAASGGGITNFETGQLTLNAGAQFIAKRRTMSSRRHP
jgi:pectate lyase